MLDKNETELCDPRDIARPGSKNTQDLEVQLVLSLALGVSALVAFCVCYASLFARCSAEADSVVDTASAMAVAVRCAQEAPRSQDRLAGAVRLFLWLDSKAV